MDWLTCVLRLNAFCRKVKDMNDIELNAVYRDLRKAREYHLKNIRRQLSVLNCAFSDFSHEKQLYVLEFVAFHIRFSIRLELLTDCEETKTGHLRFYYKDYDSEYIAWLPFNLLAGRTPGMQHEMILRVEKSATTLDLAGSKHQPDRQIIEGLMAQRSGEFIAEILVGAIPDAKIPIPLHLIGADSK